MGANNFVALQAVASNTQPNTALPSTDLWAVVPSTGLDPGFTVICVGDFEGTIVLDASLDGVGFSPVASFTLTRQVARVVAPPTTPARRSIDVYPDSGAYSGTAHGTGGALPAQSDTLTAIDLSPVVVDEVVRFVRLRVAPGTKVLTDVNVTLGGQANCDCSSGGSGSLRFVDSVEAVGTTLVALPTTGFLDGSQVFVGNTTFAGQGSVHDYFHIETSTLLSSIEGEQYPSPDEADRWYVRDHVPSARFLETSAGEVVTGAAFWGLTTNDALGTAIIDNDGFSDASLASALANPISMREMNRRGAGFSSRGFETIIQASVPNMTAPARQELAFTTLNNWYSGSGIGGLVLVGQLGTDAYTGVVTAFTAGNPLTNTPWTLSAVGIGALPGTAPFIVQSADGTITAVIQRVVNANTVEVTEPRTASAINFTVGTATVFPVSSTVAVRSLPNLNGWPFVSNQILFPAVTLMNFTGFDSTDTSVAAGETDPFLIGCLFDNIGFEGGGANTLVIACCGFINANSFQNGYVSTWSCGFNHGPDGSGRLNVVNAVWLLAGGNDSNLCNLNLFSATLLPNGGGGNSLGIWNNIGFGLRVGGFSKADISSFPLYGNAGNTDVLLSCLDNGTILTSAANLLATTSLGHQMLVADGTDGLYNFSDISVMIPGGGGVLNGALPSQAGDLLFSGTVVTSAGGAVTSFAANAGSLLSLANQTTPQRFPVSRRNVHDLVVIKTVAPVGSTDNVTVTLMLGTTPQTITVTILAADAVGTRYISTGHVHYDGTQTLDVRGTAGTEAGVVGAVGYAACVRS